MSAWYAAVRFSAICSVPGGPNNLKGTTRSGTHGVYARSGKPTVVTGNLEGNAQTANTCTVTGSASLNAASTSGNCF